MALDVKSRSKRYEKLDFLGEGQLLDAFGHKSNISLVFDFMETDLEVVIKDTSLVLTPANIKAYILMTLQGLEYMHQHWVLHRDLKPNNLLLDGNGILKLADFGLAKAFGSPNRVYTHQVVTRWYRSPELLFGARMYGVGVDMWAVGCILAELLLRLPFLAGDSDLDQLTKIFEALGTATEESWPGVSSLPDYVSFKIFPGTPLEHIFSAAGDDLLELLQGLFTFNPLMRTTATQALKMKYFSNRPGPTPGPQLPRPNCSVEALREKEPRSQMRWLGHLVRMPPGRLPGEVFRACPSGRRPTGRPRTRWRDYVSRLAWERLGIPPDELEEVAGEREVWASLLRLLPPRPDPG
ncbi:Cyclin-dependent kinase 7 [Takifugu flavidus]|uniref:Cyclin-dependent kinase 7 n=1 Tax=Takifugu flavidus TaxID=433684 RepID=A0A5C6MY70_9TELE|nr:Cyclin-dependent kinase 7 [Takifugu flavidus]